jgi:hypothetical protein
MKSTDKPEFSRKWWTSVKPADIKGSDLEKALQAAEKALDGERKGDAASIRACLEALVGVSDAVDKTVSKECDKKKHKDEIVVLGKFEDLIKSETKRLEQLEEKLAGENEDEEENDNKLFDHDYVCKMLKLMKSTGKQLNFGFGLNTNDPEASRLVISRKGNPDMLFRLLKKTGEFSNRLLTFGYAMADPEDSNTLVLKLADGADEPPQMAKLGRKFLRSDKEFRFRKLKLVMPGGRTVIDDESDSDDVASGNDDLSRELDTINDLSNAWQNALQEVSAQIEELRKALADQNDPALKSAREGLGSAVSQFPDLDLSRLIAAAMSNDRSAYNQTLKQSAKEISQVRNLLANGPILSTIDQNPFVKTSVHSTVDRVLRRIADELGVSA